MNQRAELLIDSRCTLGEGPIWHPGRQQLLWFDIQEHRLHSADAKGSRARSWVFSEPVAAAAVVDDRTVVVVSASGLEKLDLETDAREHIVDIEADKPETRSNDSRLHPSGTFWIGTMARDGQGALGSVYLFRAGALEQIMSGIKIPNATCFSPDGKTAYFADTPTRRIMRCATDPANGHPVGPWELFIDTSDDRGLPDGAVVDAEGYLWSARWGGGCVIRYAPDGSTDRIIDVPATKVTCPAFGGPGLTTLYVTTAREDLDAAQLEDQPHAGGIFAIDVGVRGQQEARLAL